MERPGPGDPSRRHGLDPAGREALAWRVADERARPPRPARAPRRHPRDLARARDRRAVRRRADGLTDLWTGLETHLRISDRLHLTPCEPSGGRDPNAIQD